MVCKISELLKQDWIIPSLAARSGDAVLWEIAQRFEQTGSDICTTELASNLLEREKKGSTAVEQGVAIPHATIHSTKNLTIVLGRSLIGIPFKAFDNEPSYLFFVIANPAEPQPRSPTHLQAISAICRLLRSGLLLPKIMAANNAEEILAALLEEEIQCTKKIKGESLDQK